MNLDASYPFPHGFLWGTATAAHQVEGGNTNNNWHQWEQTPGRIKGGQVSGKACDWWGGRWKEDLGNARDGGQNAHRLSIEWSRIQPSPDRWDESALDFYREMLRWLRQNGMTPMITLHHFTEPLWVTEKGSWENDEVPALFTDFVRRAVPALQEFCDLWITVNEPTGYVVNAYLEGSFPPGKHDLGITYQALGNMVRAHAGAYRALHELQPEAQVGFAKYYRSMHPEKSWFPPDVWITRYLSNSFNNAFAGALTDGKFRFAAKSERIPEAAKTQDFIGLNYYSRDIVAFNPLDAKNLFARRYYSPQAALSESGFLANEPDGMWDGLKWARRYDLPIYVTENGVEDSKDTLRPRFLLEHLHQVWRAANFSWRIKGYFHWSQVDNFEWERAWTQRFGLWGLDVDTQKRIRRPSADLYAEICKANAISTEMVRKYAPESMQRIFPT